MENNYQRTKQQLENRKNFNPNWDGKCETCDESPTVPISGLCGPCHFGTAEALHGDWYNDKKDELKDFI